MVTKNIEWKSKGNKIQYQFNLKQLKVLQEVLDKVQEEGCVLKTDLEEVVVDGIKHLKARQKQLRIADRFGNTGWKVVEQYELDPLAENGDDERRLRKAVGFVTEQEKLRIDREKRRRSYRNNYRGGFRGRTRFPGSRWRERGSRSRSRSRDRWSGQSPVSRTNNNERGNRFRGACFICSEVGHRAQDCKQRKK